MEIKLPSLVFVPDYHDFSFAEKTINSLVVKGRVRVKELGFSVTHSDYVGLVYTGRQPAESVIRALLEEKKVRMID